MLLGVKRLSLRVVSESPDAKCDCSLTLSHEDRLCDKKSHSIVYYDFFLTFL